MSELETQNPKEIIKAEINRLKQEEIYAGFPVGKKIPDFEALNTSNHKVRIYKELDQFVVLNFFRGDWCGYCRSELKELRDNTEAIERLGGKIKSIAPQQPHTLNSLRERLDLPFELLSDPELKIAKLFNLVWAVPDKIQKVYLKEFDLNIPELNANNSWHLPVPATYIVNTNGDVIAKFEDLNYSKRMNIERIVEILEKQDSDPVT